MPNTEKSAVWLRRILLFFCIIVLLWLGFVLFFDLFFPFTAAFFTSVLLSPLSKRIGKKTQMSLKMLRLFLLFFLMALFLFLIIWVSIRLFHQASSFFNSFYLHFEDTLQKLLSLWNKWTASHSGASESANTIAELLREAVKNATAAISSQSAAYAAKLIAKLPSMLFSLLIFFLALFYISFDYDKVSAYLASLIPKRVREKTASFKQSLFHSFKGFLRAYALLFLITFAELYVAFLFLKVEYAALLALIAASLDILPAVGVGIILVPWSLALFIGGNTARAITILVLCLAVTLIRQVIEPPIIGKQFGIHPLASLIALYVGFRLCGILGILLSPFAALIVSEALALWRRKINQEPTLPDSS